jgi:hypothetical protein
MYSVMNQTSRQYDYYETGEAEPWHSKPPPRRSPTSSLGSVPEDAAWSLPITARYVGSGELAKGRVAVARATGALGDLEPAVMVAGVAGAMVLGLALLVGSGRSERR